MRFDICSLNTELGKVLFSALTVASAICLMGEGNWEAVVEAVWPPFSGVWKWDGCKSLLAFGSAQ